MILSILSRRKTQAFLRAFGMMAMLGIVSFAKAEGARNSGRVIFKPLEIKPSPNGRDYEGRFILKNTSKKSIKIAVGDGPVEGRVNPYYYIFQVLRGGEWVNVDTTYCMLPLYHTIKPNEKCEIIVDISLAELPEPTTVRLGFVDQNLWSDPFVLNWKNDREEGRFMGARKNHFEKLRNAFAKAGFKSELLDKDDFCERFFQDILREFALRGNAKIFKPYFGEIEVLPRFSLNGDIEARVDCGSQSDGRPLYTMNFLMAPAVFNPALYVKAKDQSNNVTVYVSQDPNSVMMMFMIVDKARNKVFSLSVEYKGPMNGPASQFQSEAEDVFQHAIEVVPRWLESDSKNKRLKRH
jgi:hypothetical protein